MVGVKVGNKKTVVVSGAKLAAYLFLQKIDWTTHDLLCHNTAFDGLGTCRNFGRAHGPGSNVRKNLQLDRELPRARPNEKGDAAVARAAAAACSCSGIRTTTT